ncbi:MAG TPA: D-alanyl-D-alanine carboxypeptidase, partial [Chitinophagaceae bacterium]|nr:D-alanyl-D-alanine carboxypeptidase [Chitinophagaceae bacterium]
NKLNDEIARQQSSPEIKNRILDSIASPSLDSIVYWFLRKSVNLYGEALIKTLALNDNKEGNTENGVATIKRFWVKAGIDNDALNIYDGSGLSPLNRVTTHAQVAILQYAKTRKWFPAFYDALPIYNGMKMKSGTISDVKGFCGFHKSKSGGEYIFSFLINNYSGKTAPVVNKMYQVLDALK